MAFLNGRRSWRTAAAVALAGAVGALAGCVLFPGDAPVRREWAFSHARHAALDIACTDCHAAAETGDAPGMPRLASCRICHAQRDQGKPPERQVDSFFVDGRFDAVARGGLTDEVIYSHARHVAAGIACEACHAGIRENDDALALPRASMDACTSCHAERVVSNECATCHTTWSTDVAPASHHQNWPMRHGAVCRGQSEAISDRCVLCHQETSCASCHMTVLPRDHTNQWRRVGHGISASLDRDRCEVCHKPDTCSSCHATVEPQSHTASFGSPRNHHCLGCHEPLRNEGCVACHSGTPSHALAKPKPPDHNPAMNCRQCHIPGGVQPPMPHVDNGDNCNACHH